MWKRSVGGDFLVYYSINTDGEAVIPRAAIRMQEGQIAEVRGIAPNQNVDPFIAPIIAEKMQEFPDAAQYEKKSKDMEYVTLLESKVKKSVPFTRTDLTFLYEIDQQVEGFGYQKDPRIAELRDKRNPEDDMLVIFECSKDKIAHNEEEITPDTKAYVGELNQKVLQSGLEHIYTSFPEGKIQTYNIEAGGRTKEEYTQALQQKKIYISDYAQDLLDSPDFFTLPSGEQLALVRLTVSDLGFLQGATTNEIYQRASQWGLELCPPETGPALRLASTSSDWITIGMKQIAVRGGSPDVFNLSANDAGLELRTLDAEPSRRWDANDGFVFRTRKVGH